MLNSNVLSIESHTLDGLHVADLAKEAGVTPATIRYYSRTGLLHAQRDPHNDYRYFSPVDVKRVQFIRKAQELGLKIADIKSIFNVVEQGETPCGKVETLVRERLDAVTQQIEELRATRDRIAGAIREWEDKGDLCKEDARYCPLIEKLGGEH
jgi:DNA-binding transcriptional MerR regulator